MTDSTTATYTATSPPPARTARGQTVGTAPESRPVGVDDRAVIAVFDDLEAVQRAISKLADEGFPIDHVSIIGKDLQSELRINGFVTMGDIARPSAATGAWVGGLFGLLNGTALLFVPGAGPLIVLGTLASAAIGAAQGALVGGGIGAVLGHFVAKEKLPKYERLVATGSYLVVVHGTEDDVERARRILLDNGSTDVERHDDFRGSIDQVGPIETVFEGMRVVDANGKEIGKVDFVKMVMRRQSQPRARTKRRGRTFRRRSPTDCFASAISRSTAKDCSPAMSTLLRPKSSPWRTTRLRAARSS